MGGALVNMGGTAITVWIVPRCIAFLAAKDFVAVALHVIHAAKPMFSGLSGVLVHVCYYIGYELKSQGIICWRLILKTLENSSASDAG